MSNLEMKIDALMRYCTAESVTDAYAVRDELRQLMKSHQGGQIEANTETIVRKVLLELGVPEHLIGYPYLVDAVSMVVRDSSLLRNITKGLYPMVGKKNGTTPSRAERAIRHAIETGWDRCDMDTATHYFGSTISPSKGKPANSEYIARVANVVRQRAKEMP